MSFAPGNFDVRRWCRGRGRAFRWLFLVVREGAVEAGAGRSDDCAFFVDINVRVVGPDCVD
jgi:hypothetical protein